MKTDTEQLRKNVNLLKAVFNEMWNLRLESTKAFVSDEIPKEEVIKKAEHYLYGDIEHCIELEILGVEASNDKQVPQICTMIHLLQKYDFDLDKIFTYVSDPTTHFTSHEKLSTIDEKEFGEGASQLPELSKEQKEKFKNQALSNVAKLVNDL